LPKEPGFICNDWMHTSRKSALQPPAKKNRFGVKNWKNVEYTGVPVRRDQ